MAVYQIRLPKDYAMDQWLDDMTWALWRTFLRHAEVEKITPHAFARVRQTVGDVLERHLHKYSDCGMWTVCWSGTRSGPWMAPEPVGGYVDRFRPHAVEEHWYILEIENGLERLVDEMTDAIGRLLGSLMTDPIPLDDLRAEVKLSLKASMGPLIYQNPNCRANPMCFFSKRCHAWDGVKR